MKILDNLHLSTTQKRVLAIIIQAPTPKVAHGDVTGNAQLVAASDMLQRLGMITNISNGLELTDKGRSFAVAENIADDSGELTDDGKKLVFPSAPSPAQPQQPGALTMSYEPVRGSMEFLQELYRLR